MLEVPRRLTRKLLFLPNIGLIQSAIAQNNAENTGDSLAVLTNNIKHTNMSGAKEVKPNQLEEGDVFMEDPHPEKYEVVDFFNDGSFSGVVGKSLLNGDKIKFGGKGSYQPTLIHLESN